jgi:hypothetical protein
MRPLGQEGMREERTTKEKQPAEEKPDSTTDKMKKTLDVIKGLF